MINDRSNHPDAGRQVEIIAPSSRYRGQKGVVVYLSGSLLNVRLAGRLPLQDRLIWGASGRVEGTRGPHKTVQVRRSSVRFTGKTQKPPRLNAWHGETLALLKRASGLTRAQAARLQ